MWESLFSFNGLIAFNRFETRTYIQNKDFVIIIGAIMSETVHLHMCAERRFRSACAFVRYYRNFMWRIFIAKEAKVLHAENEIWSDCANAQYNLIFCQTHMSDGTLSHVAAQWNYWFGELGPVIQSVVSLTRSLRVISLTVLVDSIHNILIFLLKKCE